MKLFKIFFTLFLLIVLFYLGSLFFPNSYYIDRTVDVNKPVDSVFHFMQDFRNWPKWSLWNKQTDTTLRTYYGNYRSDSLGGRQYFEGERLGTGRFKFDRYERNQLLGYDLWMNNGSISAKGLFKFEQISNNTTRIHWIDSGNVGNNPMFRYMMQSKINSTQKVFDEGLLRIKQAIEQP
jgi:hypothetical protein